MIDVEIGNDGLTFDLLSKSARIAPVEPGTKEFVIEEITPGVTNAGRPRWLVWLRIVNDEKYPNTRLPYSVILPWINPQTGTWDMSNSFLLINLAKGTNVSWQGDFRNDDVREKVLADFLGKGGFMRVSQRPNHDDPSIMENQVVIVVAKRK